MTLLIPEFLANFVMAAKAFGLHAEGVSNLADRRVEYEKNLAEEIPPSTRRSPEGS